MGIVGDTYLCCSNDIDREMMIVYVMLNDFQTSNEIVYESHIVALGRHCNADCSSMNASSNVCGKDADCPIDCESYPGSLSVYDCSMVFVAV